MLKTEMEEKEMECAGFTFVTNFDSANLSRVEFVPRKPLGKFFIIINFRGYFIFQKSFNDR